MGKSCHVCLKSKKQRKNSLVIPFSFCGRKLGDLAASELKVVVRDDASLESLSSGMMTRLISSVVS